MIHPTFLISAPGGSEWILILALLLPVLALYFLPTILAANRKNPNTGVIFVLNLLLGWTFLGWIGALIWALSSTTTQPTVIVHNTAQRNSQEYKAEKQDALTQMQPPSTTTQTSTHQEKIDQLKQLKQLLDEGILTTEEFNKQKAAILG